MPKIIDYSKLKPLHLHTQTPLEELREFKKNHILSLCTPSISSTYSICVEYMRNWFKRRFQDGYFQSEFISGKNILADYLHSDLLDYIKRNKPALMIIPRLDPTYNRETTDLYMYGRNIYSNRTRYKDAFFKDPITQNLLSIEMEQLKVDFEFRVKVNSYNHAMDLYKFIQLCFDAGTTKTKYIDLDFQVPMAIMLAIANDSGFEVKDNKIVDTCGFLRYLNQHSRLPFTYKFRGTKGEYEFFIRMCNMYTHLRQSEAELGEGEKEGQLDVNFIVGLSVECLFPAPKFYAYYSKHTHHLVDKTGRDVFKYHNMCFDAIPTENDKGWNQYMSTEYVADENEYKTKKPAHIHFVEAIQSQTPISLFEIAEEMKKIYISPAAFMDIHLYNAGSRRKIHVDWNTYTIITERPLVEPLSELVFYIDLEYINNFTINHSKGYSTRLQDHDPNI